MVGKIASGAVFAVGFDLGSAMAQPALWPTLITPGPATLAYFS